MKVLIKSNRTSIRQITDADPWELMGNWHLDEDTDEARADSSLTLKFNNAHGDLDTITGNNMAGVVDGEKGNCAYGTGGANGLRTPYFGQLLGGATAFSYNIWIKRASVTAGFTGGAGMATSFFNGGNNETFGFTTYNSNTSSRFGTTAGNFYGHSQSVGDTNWHMFTLTVSPTIYKTYYDGSEIGSDSWNGAGLVYLNLPMSWGTGTDGQYGGSNYFWNTIISKKTFSPTEVTTLYNGGSGLLLN